MVGAHPSNIAMLCACSAALTSVICHYAASIGRAAQLMDKPDGALKLHKTATPVVGGLAALLPTFFVSLFYWTSVAHAPAMLFTVTAATTMLIIGMIDDRANLSPWWRLLALILIVWVVFLLKPVFVLHTLPIDFFGGHLLLALDGWIAAPVTALFIIGFVNAANMADGINGQLLGSVTVWCIFIAYYQGIEVGLPFLALASSALVASIYNLRGRLFAGNSGAYAASLFVALGAIAAYRLPGAKMSAEIPVFWFWLPVLDCVRLMVGRVLSGRSPFAGDRNHFHHLLTRTMRAGYAVAVYLALLAAPGAAAIISLTWANAVLIICIGCYGAFVFLQHRMSEPRRIERPIFAITSRLRAFFLNISSSTARRQAAVQPETLIQEVAKRSARRAG